MLCCGALACISIHKSLTFLPSRIRSYSNLILLRTYTPYYFKYSDEQIVDKQFVWNAVQNVYMDYILKKCIMLDRINVRTQYRGFSSTRHAGTVEESEKILEIKKLIKKHTCVTRDSMTPEIALHLITPSCLLWTSPLENVPFKDPFWAFYWPGGQVLARYLLDNPNFARGQRILDIGSGCGATAIAAAMTNAHTVIANDIDPVATCAISLNCTLNNIKITVCSKNIIGKTEDIEDIVLVGDMFYDDEFASVFMKWLQLLRTKGKQILIGDPGRHAFKRYQDNFECLIEYPLSHDHFSPGFSHVSVWKMK